MKLTCPASREFQMNSHSLMRIIENENLMRINTLMSVIYGLVHFIYAAVGDFGLVFPFVNY